jgi:hypothetical protein
MSIDDVRGGGTVVIVGCADALARALFDDDIEAEAGEVMHVARHDDDAPLALPDLLEDCDALRRHRYAALRACAGKRATFLAIFASTASSKSSSTLSASCSA